MEDQIKNCYFLFLAKQIGFEIRLSILLLLLYPVSSMQGLLSFSKRVEGKSLRHKAMSSPERIDERYDYCPFFIGNTLPFEDLFILQNQQQIRYLSSCQTINSNKQELHLIIQTKPLKFILLTIMYYNEPISPLFTRKPLQAMEINRSFNQNTFNTSKRSSVTHKQSIQPLKKRTQSTVLNKQNMECTFEPKVNASSKGKRSVQKFIKDQQNFQRTKEMKILQLRQQFNRSEEQSMAATPHIDQNSRQITASQRSSIRDNNIFERLSRERSSHVAPEEYLFSPKILSRSKSIIRNSDVSTLLYQDAKRRNQKQQLKVESSRQQIDLLMSPKINRNTNALVLKKINSQFLELATEEDINPLIALSILEEIFNVDLNPNKNTNRNQLVQKIIGLLAEVDNFGTMKAEKLWEFISIIVIGPSESKFFNSSEQQYIIQNFQFFYKERMTRQRKSATPQKLTFRPKTLASSKKLADSFREKTCQQLQNFIQTQKISNIQIKDGTYTIEDLFLIEHMKKQAENERKKIEKQRKEYESCTFKPDTSNSKSSMNLLKKKTKVTLKTKDRNTVKTMQTQYTQGDQQTETVSSSKINLIINRESRQRRRRQRQANNVSLSQNVKDIEKSVLRMSIGRQKRQFSQTILQRGYPKNQNWAQYQRQLHQKTIQNNKRMKGFKIK